MPADTATLAAALSAPRWGSPEALDLSVAILSLALFAGYHAWYYSWHLWVPGEPLEAALWPSDEGGGGGGGGGGDAYTRLALPPVSARHRMDQTGQTARRLFTEVGAVGFSPQARQQHVERRERLLAACCRQPHRPRSVCHPLLLSAGSACHRQRR